MSLDGFSRPVDEKWRLACLFRFGKLKDSATPGPTDNIFHRAAINEV
jgi:hypothetical protein